MNVSRGTSELWGLLRDHTTDVRTLGPPGFRNWITAHLARWRQDPVFVLRAQIRDLRRHHPRLRLAEAARLRAARTFAATPDAVRLYVIERKLTAAARAVAGISAAIEHATSEKAVALRRKLDDYRRQVQLLTDARAALIAENPAARALQHAESDLNQLRESTGLTRVEQQLRTLLAGRGRRSGRSGSSFERAASTLVQREIAPDLDTDPSRLRVLEGLTLGAARVELDMLVVRVPDQTGAPAEVLAVVEVKRNINDLAHGFLRRQEDLGWLTGDATRYDPSAYRTRRFPSGHYDRATARAEDGEDYVLTPDSFRLFRRDPVLGWFLDRLYFVTRSGPVWGMSGAALARVAARVATDPDWDPDDDGYLYDLAGWCCSLAGPVETPDILRGYAASESWGRQVLIVSPEANTP